MKNLTKIFLSIVLILVLPAMIYGQGPEKAVHIDVEGIEPGTKITYSEFVSRFGKPDSYKKIRIGIWAFREIYCRKKQVFL